MSQITSIGFTIPTAYSNKLQNGNNITTGNIGKANSSLYGENSTQQTTKNIQPVQEAKKISEPDAATEFLDYAKKTPAERLRADILKKLGLTEDDLKALPAAKRAAAEQQIAEEIKRSIEGDSKTSQSSPLQKIGSSSSHKLSDALNNTLLQLQQIGHLTTAATAKDEVA